MSELLWQYVLPYFVGTQFHPEADPISFISHLRNKEAKDKIKEMKAKEI
jgi:hypothetical protein